MNEPFITIVYNNDYICRLLILYDENRYYYSENKSYKELRDFKTPHLMEIHKDSIVLHSKNNRHLLIINI
jgi:hypothetical protein